MTATTGAHPGMALVEDAARALKDGMLPARVFHDPALYELEKEKIFKHTWVFLAHDSEIPQAGDYVLRYIADDTFIVVRDEHGEVRVLFDTCRHRGMQVCRSAMGNASHFRCPYHGWTYKNTGELIGVPFHKRIYGPDFDRSQWNLLAAAQTDTYAGLIFANLDPDAPPLTDYLGGAEWYFDFYTRKSAGGLEVVGAPQRWVVPADWKLGAENFFGDAYHTAVSHRSVVETGILAQTNANFHLEAPQWVTPHAGGGFVPIPPGSYAGYPPAIVDSWRRNASPGQWTVVEDYSMVPSHASLFPNLSFLNAASVPEADGIPVPWLTLRVWQPTGPGRMELWSWFLVEKDAPEEFKVASRKSYTLSFGSSGTLEQDDAENWSNITKGARGALSRDLYLNYQMGLDHLEPLPDWPGPGSVYPIDYTEFAQRRLWATWLEYLQK